MKNVLFTLALVASTFSNLLGLAFYQTNFGTSGLTIPSGWSATNSTIVQVTTTSVSTGYAGPPAASGSQNLTFFDSASGITSTAITVTTAGISTVGKTNIRVGMGNRKTNAFGPIITFSYSTNGTTWNNLSTDLATTFGSSTTWGFDFLDLPSDADNVSNLQFRFTFTTSSSAANASATFKIDDFAVGESFQLPAELAVFKANNISSGFVNLFWQTASETNTSHFDIQRSPDAQNWEKIGSVKAAGESRETRDYSFTDESPLPVSYYRLRSVDFDGAEQFSQVERVERAGGVGTTVIVPSSVDVETVVVFQSEVEKETTVAIFDMAGRQMFVQKAALQKGENRILLDLAALPKGVYALQVEGTNSTPARFVKL